jgi:hypothetical protein
MRAESGEPHRRPHIADQAADGWRCDGRFSFTLDVSHPRLGRPIYQRALFREPEP